MCLHVDLELAEVCQDFAPHGLTDGQSLRWCQPDMNRRSPFSVAAMLCLPLALSRLPPSLRGPTLVLSVSLSLSHVLLLRLSLSLVHT